MDLLPNSQPHCGKHNDAGSEPKNNPPTSFTEEDPELAMGRPVPMFHKDTEMNEMPELSSNDSNRRPPPLDLSQVPDTETMEWFAILFENLYRLLKEAEDKYPALARWHRTVSEVLSDTPPPRGNEVWVSPPSDDAE